MESLINIKRINQFNSTHDFNIYASMIANRRGIFPGNTPTFNCSSVKNNTLITL